MTQSQAAHAESMEAIDVLGRANPVGDRRLVNVWGKRKLDQDAVDFLVFIQLVDQRQQRSLGGVGRQIDVAGLDAGFQTIAPLGPHIDR